MKYLANVKRYYILVQTVSWLLIWSYQTEAGVWQEDFESPASLADWDGDLANFWIQDGLLHGRSAHPIAPVPPRSIHIGKDWDDYVVQCKINVHTPNLLVCSKGAIVLRHQGDEGYIFSLHAATQQVEVYRPSGEVLLSVPREIELERWYRLRAELQGDQLTFYVDGERIGQLRDQRSPRGTVGLLVQDALLVLYDDFQVTGPNIPNGGHGTVAVEAKGKLATTWGRSKTLGTELKNKE